MLVMNKEGELFDERRKGDRRVCKRRQATLIRDQKDIENDRRKCDRRKKDINK